MKDAIGTSDEHPDAGQPSGASPPGQGCRVQGLVECGFLERTCSCIAHQHPPIEESFEGDVWERLVRRWCRPCGLAGACCRSFCFNGDGSDEAARKYSVVTALNVRRGLLAAKWHRAPAQADIEEMPNPSEKDPNETVARVRTALESLAKEMKRKKKEWWADLLQLIYFHGHTNEAAAAALKRSLRTVERDRPKAEARLRRLMREGDET